MQSEKPKWILALEEATRRIQNALRFKDDPGKRIQSTKETVVNSKDVIWKPIDKTAALVVARANWPYTPPTLPRAPDSQETLPLERTSRIPEQKRERALCSDEKNGKNFSSKTKKRKGKNSDMPLSETQAPIRSGSISIGGEDYFSIKDIAVKVVEELNNTPHELTKLARAAMDGRKVLDESLYQIGKLQEDFESKVKMFLNDLRQTRFATVSEISQMTQPLKDLRQFFLGPDYSEQIRRLKEFCELCERLQQLKESGFLDSIADTLIRLS